MTITQTKEAVRGYGRVNTIQVFRGLAAILVLLFHLNVLFESPKYWSSKPYGDFFDFGHAGVEIFFVLSGLVMMLVHHKDFGVKDKFFYYLYRRFQRIYPIYWIILLFTLAVNLAINKNINQSNEGFSYYFRQISLLSFGEQDMALGVAWTLCYEVVFYLVFGLIILNKILGYFTLSLLILYGLLSGYFDTIGVGQYSYYYFIFFIGICAGKIVLRKIAHGTVVFIVGGLALFVAAAYINVNYLPGRSLFLSCLYGFGFFLSILFLIHRENSIGILYPRVILDIGDASYSLYLTHTIVLSALAKLYFSLGLETHINDKVTYLLLAFICIKVSLLFYKYIERPILLKLTHNMNLWSHRR